MKEYSHLTLKDKKEFIGSDPEKYQYECGICKATGKYKCSDDSVTKCHSCDGRGWNEYDYPVEAGPSAGCDHENIDDNFGSPFCSDCGMPY